MLLLTLGLHHNEVFLKLSEQVTSCPILEAEKWVDERVCVRSGIWGLAFAVHWST